MGEKYLKDYVVLGAWSVAFVVGAPIWIPLALIGYAADRIIDRAARAAAKGDNPDD